MSSYNQKLSKQHVVIQPGTRHTTRNCQPAVVRQEAEPTVNESAELDNGAQASSLCVVCMINFQNTVIILRTHPRCLHAQAHARCMRTHARMPTRATQTHAHARACTHTHTHRHTQITKLVTVIGLQICLIEFY